MIGLEEDSAPENPQNGATLFFKHVSSKVNDVYRNFALGDTKTSLFVLYIYLIVFCVGFVISRPVENPFLETSFLYTSAMGFLGFILGYKFKAQFTNIVGLKLTMFGSTLLCCVLLLIHAWLGFLSVIGISKLVMGGTVLLFSITAGVLSGDAQNSTWLGAALFTRHINSKLSNKGIEYLYWDETGVTQLVSPDSVRIRWSESEHMIMCYYDRKHIPFYHFTPVRRSGHRLNSAYRIVIELFDEMNSSWFELLEKYRAAITYSEVRVSWLCVAFLSLPNDPNSLTIQRAKIPVGSLHIDIDSVSYNIDWRHPKMNWEDARSDVFKAPKEKSVLATVLTSGNKGNQLLDCELKQFGHIDLDSERFLFVFAYRCYHSLMITLFHNLTGREGSVSELCRYSLQEFSRWFPKLTRDNNFASISELAIYSYRDVLLNAPSCDDWGQKLILGLDNPANLFLSSHDKLTNFANESDCPNELLSLIQTSIGDATADIMKGNRKKPGVYGDAPMNISVLSDSTSLSIAHKANVLTGGLKLQFIYYLMEVKGKLG